MGFPFANDEELKYVRADLINRIGRANIFSNFTKHSKYLYEIDYINLDYSFANKYFQEHSKLFTKPFACSSIRVGNFYGRNFDFFYNHECDFVVRTSGPGRISSLGVAGGIPGLTSKTVEGTYDPDLFRILPFNTLDGINDAGVFINTNVVPEDKGKIIHTECTENKERDMFALMWPRFVLDNFTSALEAIEYAKKHISFFQYGVASEHGYALHFMIGDLATGKTYVVEFIDNKIEYVESSIMTNFNLVGVEFNSDGTVYTPATQDATHNAMDTNKITAHGSGLERFNILVNHLNTIETKDDMCTLMHDLLNYNNAYSTSQAPLWYTESTGIHDGHDITVKTDKAIFDEYIVPFIEEEFAHRDRDKVDQTVWHTTHSSIYDLANKTLYIYDSTEDGTRHAFKLHNKLFESGTGLNSVQAKDSQDFATGDYSSATGYGTQAEANYSHTEGFITKVPSDNEHDARYGHSEGYMTEAAGLASHAEGDTTYTQNIGEHAQGRGNKSHKDSDGFGSAGNTIHSIGIAQNNQDISTFKNAVEVMQNGDVYIIGIGGYDGTNIDTAQTVQQVMAGLSNK